MADSISSTDRCRYCGAEPGQDHDQDCASRGAQENHDQKLEQAREKLAAARADLGHDLAGYSITDLLADNFPWSLEQCRQIARELA